MPCSYNPMSNGVGCPLIQIKSSLTVNLRAGPGCGSPQGHEILALPLAYKAASPMRRLSCHWLLSLLMALVLAIAPPVAAGGLHGHASCLGSLAMQDQAAWDTSGTADPNEPDATLASPCCMPCASCGASMARLSGGAVSSSIPLSGPGLGDPSCPPAPFERPPRA